MTRDSENQRSPEFVGGSKWPCGELDEAHSLTERGFNQVHEARLAGAPLSIHPDGEVAVHRQDVLSKLLGVALRAEQVLVGTVDRPVRRFARVGSHGRTRMSSAVAAPSTAPRAPPASNP